MKAKTQPKRANFSKILLLLPSTDEIGLGKNASDSESSNSMGICVSCCLAILLDPLVCKLNRKVELSLLRTQTDKC
jgi:hypothetical protein